jgi:hypothetical protein
MSVGRSDSLRSIMAAACVPGLATGPAGSRLSTADPLAKDEPRDANSTTKGAVEADGSVVGPTTASGAIAPGADTKLPALPVIGGGHRTRMRSR